MNKAELCLAIAAIGIGVLISTMSRAGSKSSLAQQFIDGQNAVSFSILVPYTEGEKRVENVKVTCDEGKCRVRVESISRRACAAMPDGGSVPFNEMIQINEYGPEEKEAMYRPKVSPAEDDETLIVQYIDSGQEAHLRVLLRWKKPVMPTHQPFIAVGGVVGEEEVVPSPPSRFASISEI